MGAIGAPLCAGGEGRTGPMNTPRVAFFTDCFHEVNGVALTSRQLDSFARKRELPFFSLHAGPKTKSWTEGAHTTVELRRSRPSVPLDAGMHFDPFFFRHLARVRRELKAFQPDVIHITGPGDCGLLGAYLAWRMGVPMVASWHTNLHEYGARRIEGLIGKKAAHVTELQMLRLLGIYYGLARVLFAPNPELLAMLEQRTRRPAFLMQRGVDTELFSPARRTSKDSRFTIGYTGRLSTEKNVRFLAEVERALLAAGHTGFRFLIVGQGAERDWLAANIKTAEFTGVLRGEALAEAYANMDCFAFPSTTDTFGNVIQEALASGLPTVVTTGGGPKFLVQDGTTGFVAADDPAFVRGIETLLTNREMQGAMSKAARQYALGVSWDAVFEKVYSAYNHTECLSSSRLRTMRSSTACE